MNKNLTNILIGELHSGSGYFERILHALMDVMPYGNTPQVKEALAVVYFELSTVLESHLFAEGFKANSTYPSSGRELRHKILQCSQLLENALKLEMGGDEMQTLCTEYLNTLYSKAYDLHRLTFKLTSIEVQYPRMNLLDMEDCFDQDLQKNFFRFFLSEEKLQLLENENTEVVSLKMERERKYHQILHQGHEAVYAKDANLALKLFSKARNLMETAEVLTLIGWCHSLLKDVEKAKTFCLKAIQLDPDYGPPYNDLGNYLLGEGHLNESLKWFNLAKKAKQFQNKEYPYINAGRAYMMKKEYDAALEEFSIALTIAPQLDELHQTVEKLKSGLDRGTQIFDKLSNHLNNQGEDPLTT